ncbi:hypothetical protein [Sphingobium ummariense]
MSSSRIGAMRADFIADTAQWDKGVAKVDKDTLSLQKRFSAMSSEFMAFGRKWVTPVVAAGTAFAAAARSVTEFADNLSTAADQAGIGVERYQTLREAFRTLEVDGDKFNQAMKRLEGTLGDLQNGVETEATRALDQMGVSARVLSGEITTTDGLLDAIAASATKAGSQAQFTSQMIDILGRKLGVDMAAALRDGGAGLHELEQRFIATGHVITEEYIQKLADANETFDSWLSSQKNDWVIWSSYAIDALSAVDEWLDRVEAGIQKKLGIDVGGAIERVQAYDRAAAVKGSKDMVSAMMPLLMPGYDPHEKPRPVILPRKTTGKKTGGATGPTDADRLENYFSALAELQGERLSLESSLTTDARERARLEHEQLAVERDSYFADLDKRVKDRQLSASSAEELKNLYDAEIEWRKRAVVHRQLDAELSRDDLEATRQSLTQQIETLGLQSDLATTAKERREIALRILDLQYQLERATLNEVLLSKDASEVAKERAKNARDALDAQYGLARQGVERDNMGPLAQYLDQLPTTAARAEEAMEQLAANGIQGVVDGLADAAMGAKNLGDVFGNVAKQIVADLLRIQIQRALFGSGGGSLFGSIINGIGGLFGLGGKEAALGRSIDIGGLRNLASLEARAGGGPVVAGRPYVVGEKRPELFVPNVSGFILPSLEGYKETLPQLGGTNSGRHGIAVRVIKGDLFDVIVDQRAEAVAGPMAKQAAYDGSIGAQIAQRRKAARHIP